MSGEVCGDDRFELIEKAKERLLDATNIMGSPEEMAVLDSILFRCWQMGWLDQLRETHVELTCIEPAIGLAEPVQKWHCDKCDGYFVTYMYDDEDTRPNYCPVCGRKVVR